jgi:hypothetical protein
MREPRAIRTAQALDGETRARRRAAPEPRKMQLRLVTAELPARLPRGAWSFFFADLTLINQAVDRTSSRGQRMIRVKH